jgi:antitoxin component YwqK of YwqJK toxin-antitoxin module
MFCKNCGTKLKKEAKFCHSCGTDSTVMPIDDSKKTEEELSRNKELLLRHLAGDLNPDEMKVVSELIRSNDWARDFLNEAAENAHAPRADIPDSKKKILQKQEEIKVKRAKIIGLTLNPKSTVKKISQESKENSEIENYVSQKEEVIDTTSPEEQDVYQTSKLTTKEVKPSHVENTDEVKDGEESVEIVSAEPKDPKCICNHCDQHISFNESMVGAEVTCPGCGNETVLYIPEINISEKIGDKSKRKRINDAKEKIVTYINKINPRKAAGYGIAVIVILLVLFYLTKQPNLLDMEVVQKIIDEEAEEDLQIRGKAPNRTFFRKNSQIPYSGWAVEYHSNGQIELLMQVYKGKRHGQTAGWYDGGQMVFHEIYKEGLPAGKQVKYYVSGQIKATGYIYKTGPDGKVTTYFENGQLETEKNFSDGKLDGKNIEYSESGEIKNEFNYNKGKEHGKCIVFAENGKKNIEYDYSNGKLDTAIVWLSNGKQKTVVKNGNGTLNLRIPYWDDHKTLNKFYPHKVQNGVVESSYKVSDRILEKMQNDADADMKRLLEKTKRETEAIQRQTEARERNWQRNWNRRR